MERKVQYGNEKQQTRCIDSRAVGVLLNKEDDVKDMIPLDKWNELQEQKRQEKEDLQRKKIITPTINDTRAPDRITYKPQHLFFMMIAAFGAGYNNCHGAAFFCE